jgi:hypothetical protein
VKLGVLNVEIGKVRVQIARPHGRTVTVDQVDGPVWAYQLCEVMNDPRFASAIVREDVAHHHDVERRRLKACIVRASGSYIGVRQAGGVDKRSRCGLGVNVAVQRVDHARGPDCLG